MGLAEGDREAEAEASNFPDPANELFKQLSQTHQKLEQVNEQLARAKRTNVLRWWGTGATGVLGSIATLLLIATRASLILPKDLAIYLPWAFIILGAVAIVCSLLGWASWLYAQYRLSKLPYAHLQEMVAGLIKAIQEVPGDPDKKYSLLQECIDLLNTPQSTNQTPGASKTKPSRDRPPRQRKRRRQHSDGGRTDQGNDHRSQEIG